MSEKKPFYELEKPTKRNFAISVVDITDKKEGEVQCQHLMPIYNEQQQMVGGLICETPIDEVSECDCCGRFFCYDHFSDKKHYHNDGIVGFTSYLCLSCAKLTPDDVEMIITFREELNR